MVRDAKLPKQKTNVNTVILGMVAVLLAYWFGSRALDTGSWWEYLISLVLAIYGIRRFIAAIRYKV